MSQQTLDRPAGYARALQVSRTRLVIWGTHDPKLASIVAAEQFDGEVVDDASIATAYKYFGDPSLSAMDEPWPEHLYGSKATSGWTPWLGVIL